MEYRGAMHRSGQPPLGGCPPGARWEDRLGPNIERRVLHNPCPPLPTATGTQYTLDKVFGPTWTTRDVYEDTTKEIIQKVGP